MELTARPAGIETWAETLPAQDPAIAAGPLGASWLSAACTIAVGAITPSFDGVTAAVIALEIPRRALWHRGRAGARRGHRNSPRRLA